MITKKIKNDIRKIYRKIKIRYNKKVFCIGRNKTGTTSLGIFLSRLGIIVAKQWPAELLFCDVQNGDYSTLINYVKYNGQAFQDNPFSLNGTYKIMDKAFPKSKFILTIRDSPDQWYKSVTSFHSKLMGINHVPTKEDLMNCNYVKKGWMWEVNRFLYTSPEHDIYNEEILKKHYTDYNNEIIEYFKDRPKDLLIVNIKEENAAIKICNFLGTRKKLFNMPWENKT
jgi:hypothetical protein